MRKLILTIIIFIVVLIPFQSYAKSDKQLVKQYCKSNYPRYKIEYVTKYNANIMENRKGKKIVYVEIIKSKSNGDKSGRTKEGYYIAYNKKVKKGKKVVSYCLYNPNNNYCDDVIAVVDNKMIR